MSYTRLNLSDGDVFNASHVSHIEDGIVSNESDIAELNQSLTDDIAELKDSLAYYNRMSEVTLSDYVSQVGGCFYVNGNTAIMHGYFVINAGSYSMNDEVFITLPVKPKALIHFLAGDQNGIYVFRVNTSGQIVLNNSATITSNKYIFSDLVFAIA